MIETKDNDQKRVFLESEGDQWFKGNASRLESEQRGEQDPVVQAVKRHGVRPRQVLEIGCSTGWRLA